MLFLCFVGVVVVIVIPVFVELVGSMISLGLDTCFFLSVFLYDNVFFCEDVCCLSSVPWMKFIKFNLCNEQTSRDEQYSISSQQISMFF